jgi:hypothetical protein
MRPSAPFATDDARIVARTVRANIRGDSDTPLARDSHRVASERARGRAVHSRRTLRSRNRRLGSIRTPPGVSRACCGAPATSSGHDGCRSRLPARTLGRTRGPGPSRRSCAATSMRPSSRCRRPPTTGIRRVASVRRDVRRQASIDDRLAVAAHAAQTADVVGASRITGSSSRRPLAVRGHQQVLRVDCRSRERAWRAAHVRC